MKRFRGFVVLALLGAGVSDVTFSQPVLAESSTVLARDAGGWGMAVAPNGDWAAADYAHGTVTIRHAASVIRTYSGLRHPHDVAWDRDGNLYIAQMGRDLGSSAVARVDASTGNVDPSWRTRFAGAGGVTVALDGAVWVADSDGHALFRIPAGGSAVAVPGNWPMIHGLRFAPDGSLFIAATTTGQILRRDQAGNVSVWADGFGNPMAVLPDADGGLYVADQTENGFVYHLASNRTRTQVVNTIGFPSGLALVGQELMVGTCYVGGRSAIVKVAVNPTPVQMPGTGNWYEPIATPMTVADAKAYAAQQIFHGMPGHLVDIENDAENQFVGSIAFDDSLIANDKSSN